MSNQNFEALYNEACELLGKKKPKQGEKAEKFDLSKQIKDLIKNRDFWKKVWEEQHSATGRAYWWGYGEGYEDKTKGLKPKLIGGLRTKSK